MFIYLSLLFTKSKDLTTIIAFGIISYIMLYAFMSSNYSDEFAIKNYKKYVFIVLVVTFCN